MNTIICKIFGHKPNFEMAEKDRYIICERCRKIKYLATSKSVGSQ